MTGKNVSVLNATHAAKKPRAGNVFALCIACILAALPVTAAKIDLAATNSSDLADLSLEKLMDIEVPTVYAASKFEQKETQAPASVTVITSDDIKRFGYRTLADVLQSVAGFNVSNDRNYSFLGARGIGLGDFNSRFLLLVDGHRVNNNLTDGAYIGSEFILDVDMIDRVEIIRGANAVLYGNNAFFAVINVITRRPDQVNGAEVSGSYGSDNSVKSRITYGQSFTNGLSMLLSGTYFHSDGQNRIFFKQFNTPSQNNGIADDRDADFGGSVFASLAYGDFSLEAAFNHREKGNPTAQYSTTFDDWRLKTVDERGYVNLKYDHTFSHDWELMTRLYYDRSDFSINYPVTPFLFKENQTGQWWGTEVQVTKRLWDVHTITFGGEYRDDFEQHRRLEDSTTVFTDVNRNRQSYGIFVQGDFAVVTNLHINAGVRYDQYGSFGPAIDPRIALIYNPIESATLKFIYSQAFRAPNFLELSDPNFQNISPEKITSYELVYEQRYGKHVSSSLSGFYNDMKDLIVFQNGNFQNFNAQTKGMELAGEANWAKGWKARASYSFQQTHAQTSIGLPDSPAHLLKANITAPLYEEKIFASLELQYTSDRKTIFTDTMGNTLQGPDTAGYAMVNFTLFSENLVKNLDFSASIYNLLDTKYSDPASRFHLQPSLPQPGRTFRVQLTYRF